MIISLCLECGKAPVYIKKRGLCRACANKYYRDHQVFPKKERNVFWRKKPPPKAIDKIQHKAELKFVSNYFKHNKWIYEPATFRFNGKRYTPDFYDKEREIFIEVVGSRQSYHQNKERYEAFLISFPGIRLEIRTPDGNILKPESPCWQEHGVY